MGRMLGVADSTADIDGGIVKDLSSLTTASGSTVGFYGATPATQRASSAQASSNLATSSSFGATQLAAMQEIMNTLTAIGAWKGSA